ncbi:MAG TPA: ATP-binding protein [Anaeromyxobacteraceae bacterium]|nr:ATP-binding protein [Anaeromyxobacteraceae bacterium]
MAASAAALAQYLLLPTPSIAPFVFFYLGVALTSWIAGRGPGLATVLCSAILGNWLFLGPPRQFHTSGPAVSASLLFAVSAGAIALLCAGFRNALLEARQTAARLRRQAILLRDADQRKNEFLGVLSHELRNPLSAIRVSMHIAGRVPPESPSAERALAVVDRQLRQLTRLVDDLLDVTRISRGKVRLQRETVDLQALVTHAAEDHAELFEKNGLRLEVVAEDDEPILVSADPARVTQIIGNLLQNAAKFTPRGARTTVSVTATDEVGEVSVHDTGDGIHPDVLENLFEPFVQAENTLERSAGGLGLGLALVKGLVELHGGTVQVDSAGPGKGTNFIVRLPLCKGRARRPPVLPGPPEPPASRRVLVVEDNIDAAESLKEALELNGHTVFLAYTGPEGVQRARDVRPDVVLCDIGLPGMNGYDVARAIRADPDLCFSRLIALSGYALPEDVDRARAAGFDQHLAKPADLSVLEHSIAATRADADPS